MQRGCSWNLSGNPDKSVTGLSTSTLIGLGTMFGADGSPVLLTTLLRDVSRSFYLTLRVLPSRVRAPIGLAYLLARATDTLADASSVPVAARRAALESLRDRILDEPRTRRGRTLIRALRK